MQPWINTQKARNFVGRQKRKYLMELKYMCLITLIILQKLLTEIEQENNNAICFNFLTFCRGSSQKQVVSLPPSLSTTTNNTTVTWFAQTTIGFSFKLLNTNLNFRLIVYHFNVAFNHQILV